MGTLRRLSGVVALALLAQDYLDLLRSGASPRHEGVTRQRGLGDRALVVPAGDYGEPTRVVVRKGNLLVEVALHSALDPDSERAAAVDLARRALAPYD